MLPKFYVQEATVLVINGFVRILVVLYRIIFVWGLSQDARNVRALRQGPQVIIGTEPAVTLEAPPLWLRRIVLALVITVLVMFAMWLNAVL